MNKAEFREFIRDGMTEMGALNELIIETRDKINGSREHDPVLACAFDQMIVALGRIYNRLNTRYNADGTVKEGS